MTANEATKACMANLSRYIDLDLPADDITDIERVFTEIISQVTPPQAPKRTVSEIAACLASRLPAPTQGGAAGYNPADLCNSLSSPVGKLFHEAYAGEARRADDLMCKSFHEDAFPQEIVEPQPKPWWKRIFA